MSRRWGLGLLLASVMGLFGAWYYLYRDTSIYASRFSEERFVRVRVGMPASEVIDLLGPPLSIDQSISRESWTYVTSSGEKRGSIAEGELSQIAFSETGHVIFVSGRAAGLVKIGWSRLDVKNLLGSPRWHSGPRSKVMHYSRPANYGVFNARIIELDEDEIVTGLVAYRTSD
jgi:outer membrane protein assembly factor BamE (lipoprotein component of BamABCDE complex)